MAIKKDKHHQDWLLPPRIEDRIPENHNCYLIRGVLEALDFSQWEEQHQGRSRPAYHPVVLIGILILGLTQKIKSSRVLAQKATTDLAYMYVAGKLTPDFRTIARFRKENEDLIQQCFKEVVKIAHGLGMVTLGELAIDGTIVKANASIGKNLTKKELEFIEQLIHDELQKGIELDEEEDELFGEDNDGRSLPEGARRQLRELIKKKLEEAEIEAKNRSHIKKLAEEYAEGDERKREEIEGKLHDAKEKMDEEDLDLINLTDPDSPLMKNKKKQIVNGYNPQIAVDGKEKIIVASDVTQDANDKNQFQPQLEAVEENVGPLPPDTKGMLDCGYSSPENRAYAAERGLDLYMPDQYTARRMNGHSAIMNPFHKTNMPYDLAADVFICPAGIELHRKYEYPQPDGGTKAIYTTTACKNCALSGCCFKSGSQRMITVYGDEAQLRAMREKLSSEEGRKVYRRRAEIVEPPFGTIKHQFGLREFSTRGLTGVRNEWRLACIAKNITRIGSFLKSKSKTEAKGCAFRGLNLACELAASTSVS